MPETESRSPAMLLQAAASLAPFPVKDGWPEQLTPTQLANLQYPVEGVLQAKQQALLLRNSFVALVQSEIDAGQLAIVSTERKVFVPEPAPMNHHANGIGSDEWRCRDSFSASSPSVQRQAAKEVPAIARAACVKWLLDIRERPSQYVAAWLGVQVKPGMKESATHKKRAKLTQLLKAISGLDRSAMPGQTIDFHALARAYDKAAFSVAASTFSDYLDKSGDEPKLCTFKQGAQRDSKFYKKAGASMGVKEDDYQSALVELEKQAKARTARKTALT